MSLPQELIRGAMLHFESGVPICDLNISAQQRERMARVSHVYWQWRKNPYLDAGELFRQMNRGRCALPSNDCHMAQRDKQLFDFVIEHVSGESRRVSEARVRAAANHLTQMGMETDNGRDIEAGAKLLMKLDRLDQPESEQADLSKTVFLPPVVTTVASEVDPTKDDMDDQTSRAIMNKYGGYIDEKRTLVEEKVAVLEARSQNGLQENEKMKK